MNSPVSSALAAYSGNASLYASADLAAAAAKTATNSAQDDQEAALPLPQDRVTLSSQALALAQHSGSAGEHVAEQPSAELQFPDPALMARLRAAGIPTQPAFVLSVDPSDHHVSVLGARPDAARIAAMVQGRA